MKLNIAWATLAAATVAATASLTGVIADYTLQSRQQKFLEGSKTREMECAALEKVDTSAAKLSAYFYRAGTGEQAAVMRTENYPGEFREHLANLDLPRSVRQFEDEMQKSRESLETLYVNFAVPRIKDQKDEDGNEVPSTDVKPTLDALEDVVKSAKDEFGC